MKSHILFFVCTFSFLTTTYAQTKQDSLAIKQVALDYIASQHNPNPEQFERAAHPRMVKRTFWKDNTTQKEYLRETFTDYMILLAEGYNTKGDRFPENPQKRSSFLMFQIELPLSSLLQMSGLIICIL